MKRATAVLAATLAVAFGPPASAQDLGEVAGEVLREQSCLLLAVSTVGLPEIVDLPAGGNIPSSWREAPPGLLPERVNFRTETESFNRLYEFATRDGLIYVRKRGAGGPWREIPLPPCFSGRVASISVDDDELIALDTARRIYTMDNALKEPFLFSWSSRWGTPFWLGLGYTLPHVRTWAWSVISPFEDKTWTDPAGNRTNIGDGKVSHIWGLRRNRRTLTFWDPWLPPDDSYEMCGPHRGRFKSVALSASGSYVFVIGKRGDMFTRLYDFDISGHNDVFFNYAWNDQRGAGPGAPIQLPAAGWVEQPKIPGKITSLISIHKVGRGAVHRIMRVEGRRKGRTGYWERDVADPRSKGWRFHATGGRLRGKPLANPQRDTSARGLGPSGDVRYVMRGPVSGELPNFNFPCSPARLRVRDGNGEQRLRLHYVDSLRQQARARGLDRVPRMLKGAIKYPNGHFEEVTLRATHDRVVVEERGWVFERAR